MFTPFSHKIYNPNIYNRCMLQCRSTILYKGQREAGRSDPASKVRGAMSIIFCSQVSLRAHYCKRRSTGLFHTSAVTKQWTAKWPYIANAVFRIAQNYCG